MPGILTNQTLNTEFLFGTDYTDTDWHEDILKSRQDSFSRDRGACRLTIITEFERYKAAERFILGYPWVDSDFQLRREVPVFHPDKTQLYAKAITSTTFHAPNGKATTGFAHALPFATYELAEIEMEFADVKYDVLRDEDMDTLGYVDGDGYYLEYLRYVERRSKPYSELISIDGGQMLAVAPSIATLNQTTFFSAPHVLARLQKSMFTLTWHEVPREFVEDDDGRQTKLEAIQKTINETEFMGYPAGTLLCEEVDSVPSPSSIASDALASQKFMLDITFTFKYFEPLRGDTSVDVHGWNLLPAPRASGAAGDTMTAWILYTHNGATIAAGGKPLYQSTEFRDAFKHHLLS